jgi:hypothetical protein
MIECLHQELKWNMSAMTSVMGIQTTIWGVECVACGRKWDVGEVLQAVVDISRIMAERDALRAKIDLADRALLRAALVLSGLAHGDLIGDTKSIALHAAADAAKARCKIEGKP